MTSKNLPNHQLGTVNPLGELCFDAAQQKVLYRGEILPLNDGELRFAWWLLTELRGLTTAQLLERCWHDGNPNQLHKAAHTLRKHTRPDALIQRHGTYRLNAKFFTSIPVPFEDLIAKWRERPFLPLVEFVEQIFPAEIAGRRPETLVYAADATVLIRANIAKFADSIRAGRTFFIVTALGTIERIPTLLQMLYQELENEEDPIAIMRGALTLVIAEPHSGFATAPLYFLDSHDPNRCVQFTLRCRNSEAVLLDYADDASASAETLRANFLRLEEEGMLCVKGSAASVQRLTAGIVYAFRNYDSPDLTQQILSACFDPPARKTVSASLPYQAQWRAPNASSAATTGLTAARQSK